VTKDDIPGAKAIFEDLKIRLPDGKRKSGANEGTPDGE
jgi:hypothetical protein